MIVRRNRGRGGDPPGPKITFQLVGGSQLRVVADWEKGQDLSLFGHLLVYLCQGRLLGSVGAAVTNQSINVQETEKGAAICSLLQQAFSGVERGADGDEPLVCPTMAVRINMKPFQGMP
jgi:hypothetical protein